MVRGTTHVFRFDCSQLVDDLTLVTEVEAVFQQGENDTISITKTLPDCIIDNIHKEIDIILAPEETIQFSDKKKLKTQIRGKVVDAKGNSVVFGNHIQLVTVYPVLSDTQL